MHAFFFFFFKKHDFFSGVCDLAPGGREPRLTSQGPVGAWPGSGRSHRRTYKAFGGGSHRKTPEDAGAGRQSEAVGGRLGN